MMQAEKFASHSIKAYATINPFGQRSKLQLYKGVRGEKEPNVILQPQMFVKFTKTNKIKCQENI